MLSIDTIRNSMSISGVVASGETPTHTEKEQKLYTELLQLVKQSKPIEIIFGKRSERGRLHSMSFDHLMVNVSDAIVPQGHATVTLSKQRSSGQFYSVDRIDIL